jgi:uncharacterized lipoprotein YajG
VPIGDIQTGRNVAGFVQSVLTDALRASGHTVTSDGATAIAGEVSKFWVHTDTTPLYWDIVGEIELRVSLRGASQAAPSAATTFACEHTERTWLWPSEDLVQQVLDRCVDKLGQAIAKDPIWRESPAPTPTAGQTSDGTS